VNNLSASFSGTKIIYKSSLFRLVVAENSDTGLRSEIINPEECRKLSLLLSNFETISYLKELRTTADYLCHNK